MFKLTDKIIERARKHFLFLDELNEKKEQYKKDLRHVDSCIDKEVWSLEGLMTDILKQEDWYYCGGLIELKQYHQSQSLIKIDSMEMWCDNNSLISSKGTLRQVSSSLNRSIKEATNET